MANEQQIDLTAELERAEQQAAQTTKLLQANGFVVDTTEWLTIKRYAEKYSLDTHVVTNWIRRGVIPTDCTMVLPEINDIRLVKDQPYK